MRIPLYIFLVPILACTDPEEEPLTDDPYMECDDTIFESHNGMSSYLFDRFNISENQKALILHVSVLTPEGYTVGVFHDIAMQNKSLEKDCPIAIYLSETEPDSSQIEPLSEGFEPPVEHDNLGTLLHSRSLAHSREPEEGYTVNDWANFSSELSEDINGSLFVTIQTCGHSDLLLEYSRGYYECGSNDRSIYLDSETYMWSETVFIEEESEEETDEETDEDTAEDSG